MDKLRDVEVICHYSTEGKITPLRVKLVDEDSQRQAFVIKEYRDLSGQGARTQPTCGILYTISRGTLISISISLSFFLTEDSLRNKPESQWIYFSYTYKIYNHTATSGTSYHYHKEGCI